MTDPARDMHITNTNHFTCEQAGLILWIWGQDRNLNLRLAVHREDQDNMLIGTETDEDQPHTIWIYNDDAEDTQEGTGHFEGLRPKQPQAVKSKQRTERKRQRNISDSEDEDDSDDKDENPIQKKRAQLNDDVGFFTGKHNSKTANAMLTDDTTSVTDPFTLLQT